MNCYKHYEREAVHTCKRCGEGFCQECIFEVDGQRVCKDCIGRILKDEHPHKAKKPPEGKARMSAPPYGVRKNWGLLFVFSFIMPGINYMYLGLIKRGLFTMSAFFLLVYCLTLSDNPLFAFGLGILWITSIFDGFNLRHRINAGAPVEDGISDVNEFFTKNKYTIIWMGLLLFAISFLASILRHLGHYGGRGSSPMALIIILIVAYLILKKKDKKDKKDKYDEIIDKRND